MRCEGRTTQFRLGCGCGFGRSVYVRCCRSKCCIVLVLWLSLFVAGKGCLFSLRSRRSCTRNRTIRGGLVAVCLQMSDVRVAVEVLYRPVHAMPVGSCLDLALAQQQRGMCFACMPDFSRECSVIATPLPLTAIFSRPPSIPPPPVRPCRNVRLPPSILTFVLRAAPPPPHDMVQPSNTNTLHMPEPRRPTLTQHTKPPSPPIQTTPMPPTPPTNPQPVVNMKKTRYR